jgi:hypothetical protein
MGYQTDFYGAWSIDPPLTAPHLAYLRQFAEIRHMRRDVDKLASMLDPLREAVGLPLGFEGAYYVGTTDAVGSQAKDDSVLDGNNPPGVPNIPPKDPVNFMGDWAQRYAEELVIKQHALTLGLAVPGLWCQWRPDDSGTVMEWDGGEKFYEYIDWIEYLIEHFLQRWGYRLNGTVEWQGEDRDDIGRIVISNNIVKTQQATVVWK